MKLLIVATSMAFLLSLSPAYSTPAESSISAIVAQQSVSGKPVFTLARYIGDKGHIILSACPEYANLKASEQKIQSERMLRKLAENFGDRPVSMDVVNGGRLICSADYLPKLNHIKLALFNESQNRWQHFASLIKEEKLSGSAHRCEICGRILGKEVPESALSKDPDFKQHGMFQVCQRCLDRNMDAGAQENYVQVALKYKWNSIAHNETEEVKVASAKDRARQEMLARRELRGTVALK